MENEEDGTFHPEKGVGKFAALNTIKGTTGSCEYAVTPWNETSQPSLTLGSSPSRGALGRRFIFR